AIIGCYESLGHSPTWTQLNQSAMYILPKPFPIAHLRTTPAAPRSSLHPARTADVNKGFTTFTRSADTRLIANKFATFAAPNGFRTRAQTHQIAKAGDHAGRGISNRQLCFCR